MSEPVGVAMFGCGAASGQFGAEASAPTADPILVEAVDESVRQGRPSAGRSCQRG